ncbi:MAG: transposase [Phycisphaerales bacterium]|nr:transposase [Phycisphaerales bacterium]
MDSLPRRTREAWNEPGHAHFLTYSCYQRLPLLTGDRARRWVVDALASTRSTLDVALWAYAIMPEHVHVLFCPRRADYEMRRILANLKHPVSDAARAFLDECENEEWLTRLTVEYPSRSTFRFWQPGGGYDKNLFRGKTLPAVINYIHANPVRRGLVDEPLDWNWSSARHWEGYRDVPLEMDEILT